MKSYSQNNEAEIITAYFGNYKGTLFDIGANDGITLSNSYNLIELGWNAHLFEPGSVYDKLFTLHQHNDYVRLNNFGLSDKCETLKFWESEAHVLNGSDYGLVSTTVFEETKRWPNVVFHEKEIMLTAFNDYWQYIGKPDIDFISLDVEGMEWQILQSIDLCKVGCSCLCVEHNGNIDIESKFTNYSKKYGLKLGAKNNENLLFFR
jgi:FkbM family methyltransferase